MSDPLTTPERAPDPNPTPEPVREARHIVATLREYKRIGAAIFGVVTALGGAGAYVYPWGTAEADPVERVAVKVEEHGKDIAELKTTTAVTAEAVKNQKETLGEVKAVVEALRANTETILREIGVSESKIRKPRR